MLLTPSREITRRITFALTVIDSPCTARVYVYACTCVKMNVVVPETVVRSVAVEMRWGDCEVDTSQCMCACVVSVPRLAFHHLVLHVRWSASPLPCTTVNARGDDGALHRGVLLDATTHDRRARGCGVGNGAGGRCVMDHAECT